MMNGIVDTEVHSIFMVVRLVDIVIRIESRKISNNLFVLDHCDLARFKCMLLDFSKKFDFSQIRYRLCLVNKSFEKIIISRIYKINLFKS